MKKIILIGAMFSSLLAQNLENEIEFWENNWQTKSLKTFVELGEKSKWLSVHSGYSIKKNDYQLTNRVNVLFEDLKSTLRDSLMENTVFSVERIEVLFDLESQLLLAGGYRNKMLSICVASIAAAEIAQLVDSSPEKADDLRVVLEKRNSGARFEPMVMFEKYAADDAKFERDMHNLEKILTKAKKENWNYFGLMRELANKLPYTAQNTIGLDDIYEPANVYFLLMMYSSSELQLRYTCPGLLSFVEKGGSLKKLKQHEGDTTYISKVMGRSLLDFRFPFFDKKELAAGSILLLMEKLESDASKAEFIKTWGLIDK